MRRGYRCLDCGENFDTIEALVAADHWGAGVWCAERTEPDPVRSTSCAARNCGLCRGRIPGTSSRGALCQCECHQRRKAVTR